MSEDSKIKKILFNEVTACVAIIGVVVGIMNWVQLPQKDFETNQRLIQQDITLIKENHMKHIETIEGNIRDMQKEVNSMKETEVQLMTIISERLPKK